MRSTLLFCVLFAACRGPVTKQVDPNMKIPDPVCGDGKIDPGEDCDGSDLGTATCQSKGFDTGQITCNSKCQYVTTLCVKRCGNGHKDLGEACDGTDGVEACDQFGYRACSDTCTLDNTHCVTQGFEAAPGLQMTKGGPAVIGDVSPRGPGDLIMAVPSYGRVEAIPWLVQQGFQSANGRKLSFQTTPVFAMGVDLDEDGNQDIVNVNDDGTVDELMYGGASFSAHRQTNAGCVGGVVIGTGHFVADAGVGVALQCAGTGLQLITGGTGALRVAGTHVFAVGDLTGDGLADAVSADGTTLHVFAAPGFAESATQTMAGTPVQLALGDVDGDGDLDLAMRDATPSIVVFENTGTAFVSKATFSATAPRDLRLVDVDLDGRTDVVWGDGATGYVRRNRGTFLFTEYKLEFSVTGTPLSFSVGDLDGDGDPDATLTVSTGGDTTDTRAVINRVR